LIILARHAQSEHHVRGLTGGWTDTPLTELGHEQAQRLAKRLATELQHADVAVYASDLQRATQTATHIASALGVEPIVDARLREYNNGAAANMTIDDAHAAFPTAQNEPWRADDRPYPEAESVREFFARASAFLASLGDGVRVPIVVSHGGTIEAIVLQWLGLGPDAVEAISLGMHPTGITTLTRGSWDCAMVERMNDASHLIGMESDASLAGLLR
jgi:probable phosphoglycerate mutase